MSKTPFLAAAVLAVAILAIPAHAQDTKKEAAIKPPDTPSKALLDSWNDIGRKLIAMAEDFPEDKYDFKPTPAQRSFAEQLLHAANANYFFTNRLLPRSRPRPPGVPSQEVSSAAVSAAVCRISLPVWDGHSCPSPLTLILVVEFVTHTY
jgi:hypothetical protein